jgi:DNA damage-inducible protein 1
MNGALLRCVRNNANLNTPGTQCYLLLFELQVNGVPVKAFVDSGAQMTIMTHEFAAKCYLTRLLDKRFAGMAVGVGSSRILGRIHQAPLKVRLVTTASG